MRMTPFTALRGRDGRSLVRALVVLLLVNALAAGLHAGFTVPAFASICGSPPEGSGAAPGLPHGHAADCCLAGCATPFAVTPDNGGIALPARTANDGPALLREAAFSPPVLADAAPRGPPLPA